MLHLDTVKDKKIGNYRKKAALYLIEAALIWWVLRGSNPRPSPCKGDALPAELSTRNKRLVMSYFHMAKTTLSSALRCFTTEFGMGSGGTTLLWSPNKTGKIRFAVGF